MEEMRSKQESTVEGHAAVAPQKMNCVFFLRLPIYIQRYEAGLIGCKMIKGKNKTRWKGRCGESSGIIRRLTPIKISGLSSAS